MAEHPVTPTDDQAVEPNPATPRSGPSRTRTVVEWGAVVVGAVLIALLVRALVFQPFYIPSSSMVPTLHIGDRVLVNKLSYRFGDVNRGDVVVFSRPEKLQNSSIEDLIKRVIALPGDSVVIKDEHVYLNGQALDESYTAPGSTTNQGPIECTDPKPCIIPDGQVWVMGDNRNNSQDSRWFGPIPQDDIVGRAFLRMWPLGDIGFL